MCSRPSRRCTNTPEADHVDDDTKAEARAAALAEAAEKVRALLDSPAAYPAPMGPTIRAENDVVRAVLAILEE
jgi:hypothetical protein